MQQENDNQPQVTSETKFEARGFRSDDSGAEEQQTDEQLVEGMPSDGEEMSAADADQAAEELQGSGGETKRDETAKKEPRVKIGDREFETAEAAWTYAQELEREKLAADAFRHGVETATKGAQGNIPETPQAPEEFENFETEFYADPKNFLKKYGQKISEQVTQQIHQNLEMKRKNEDTWAKFRSTYPDLAGQDEFSDVQAYIFKPENWQNLQHMETDRALKIAADAVRDKYRRILQNRSPGQELKTVKSTASPGNGINVTPKEKSEQALNFVQQTRQLKAKRTARPMRR